MIDSYARSKLKKSLKKSGLVETLVWNRRTGNLVGGHQRLSVLDELEGTQDYLLTVAAVDVDDATERALNVALNNVGMQGAYDEEKLAALVSEAIKLGEELDRELMGFDESELRCLAGEASYGVDVEKRNKDVETSAKIKHAEKEAKEKQVTRTDGDANHYLVIVFSNTAELNSFRDKMSLQKDETYFDGEMIAQRAGFTLRG